MESSGSQPASQRAILHRSPWGIASHSARTRCWFNPVLPFFLLVFRRAAARGKSFLSEAMALQTPSWCCFLDGVGGFASRSPPVNSSRTRLEPNPREKLLGIAV